MTRALVAGVGNVFFGDDGFGVEVARQLAATPPTGTQVVDFGIRAIHLAYELLSPVSLCIVADCCPRGGEPGTLYVLEPDVAPDVDGGETPAVADAHGMNLAVVFSAIRELGGTVPPMLLVGCEPAATEPGIGLSPRVRRAVPAAVELIRELVTSHQARQHE
jgi:hydrogenase maturation protease